MQTSTRRSFLATIVSGALAISCLGITGCSVPDEEIASNEPDNNSESVISENYVSPIKGVEADWNVPGYYTYENDDPDSLFQKFEIVVGKHNAIDELLDGDQDDNEITIHVSPYLNPKLFEVYQETNPGIYNVDKALSGDLSISSNKSNIDGVPGDLEGQLQSYVNGTLSEEEEQSLKQTLLNSGYLCFSSIPHDRVMDKEGIDTKVVQFTIEFPITSSNDFTHLTLTNAFIEDDESQIHEAFAFSGHEDVLKEEYGIDYYVAPIHFTCVSFTPMDIKTDEEKAQEEAALEEEAKAVLREFNQRMAEEMRE